MIKKNLIKTSLITMTALTLALGMTACGSKKNTTVNTDNTATTKAVVQEQTTQKQEESVTTIESTSEETTAEAPEETGESEETTEGAVEVAVNDTQEDTHTEAPVETPVEEPVYTDTPAEPAPTPAPEPVTEAPAPAEPNVEYIKCITYPFNDDATLAWKITWDILTPTSNKYIYYKIRDGKVYEYYIFNEKIDTAIISYDTTNPDVEHQTKNYVEAEKDELPYLVY